MNKKKIPAAEYSLTENEAFMLPLSELKTKLKTNPETGLTQQEAKERLLQVGINSIPKIAVNRMKMYLAPLSNWLIAVYLIVSTILAFLAIVILPQLWFQIAVWLPIITGNIAVIIVQSIRAERGTSRASEALKPQKQCEARRKNYSDAF